MSKVMSPDELEAAIARLQANDKLRMDKKAPKKDPKEDEIKEENLMLKI